MASDTTMIIAASPAASLLLAAMAVTSLYALFRQPDWLDRGVFRPYWLARRNEWGTLVSSAFLHADLTHLFFNGFTFWAFGFGLERALGTPQFIALYLVGLLASDALTWLQHRGDSAYRTLGASGAIGAVLFASIIYAPQASIFILPIPVPIPAPLFGVLYLAYSIWAAKRGGGRVNHDAHIGGAVAGVAFVLLVDPQAAVAAWQWLTN